MKRIRLGARLPALVFLAPLGSGIALLHGCIPEADISGLPPYDAGVVHTPDATVPPTDSGTDVSVPATDASDSAPPDSGPGGTATITGMVIDFTQGNGRGVVPGATVAVLNGPTTTSDANGLFVLPNVAAGTVQLNVSKATDTTAKLAYSTTQLVFTLASGATANVQPVLHEGCIATLAPADGGASIATSTCSTRTGAALALKLKDSTTLVDVSGTPFLGTARVEMVPLEYPKILNGSTQDLSWAAGLPGASTPPGLIAGAEVRVVDDETGAPLALAPGKTATITLPAFKAAQGALTALHFDAAPGTGGAWVTDNGVTPGTPGTTNGVNTVDVTVPHLTWWGVASAPPASGCVSGALTASGVAAAGVLVRGIGSDWVGTATALTDAQGKFCLDVPAASHVTIAAGLVPQGGGPFGIAQPFPQSPSGASGACAGGGTACTDLGTITMLPLAPSCAAGSLVNADGTSPTTTPVDVYLNPLTIDPAQKSAGVLAHAYVGQITPSNGAFCLPTSPGLSTLLVNPGDPECGSPSNATIATSQAATVGACGTAGCLDAGSVGFGCGALPF